MLFRVMASDEKEFYDLSVNSLTNLDMNDELKKVDYSQSECISLSEIEDYTYIDYGEDITSNSRQYSLDNKNIKFLRISRIQPKKNNERYPEFLYVYSMTGPSFQGWTTPQYAYVSFDKLLYDISWIGIKYSYLNSDNIYEKDYEYDNAPSSINGISQSEYEDIKNGKYPNIHITDEDESDNIDNSSSDIYNQHSDTVKEENVEESVEENAEEDVKENTKEEITIEPKSELVKTYNTIKIESNTDYHIIEIFKHENNKFSYQMYWYVYNDKIPTKSSNEEFDTIDEALNDIINKSEMKMSISDLTEQ